MNALSRKLVSWGLMEPEPGWFEVFLTHLRAYKAERRHCRVPKAHVCADGYTLGGRTGNIRSGRTYLTDEQRAILDADGFLWDASPIGAWWSEFIEHFRAFKTEHGHCRVPKKKVCPDGYQLGKISGYVRSGSNKPTDEQRVILDAEGFLWNTSLYGQWWPEFIERFRAYKGENGHCRVLQNYICSDGYNLGRKVNGIRTGNHKITNEQRAILDAEGFVWNASLHGQWWPEFIEHLRVYKAEYGHCRVSYGYVCPDGYKLGQRVLGLRTGNNKPTDEQRAILDAEGFIWKPKGSSGTPTIGGLHSSSTCEPSRWSTDTVGCL